MTSDKLRNAANPLTEQNPVVTNRVQCKSLRLPRPEILDSIRPMQGDNDTQEVHAKHMVLVETPMLHRVDWHIITATSKDRSDYRQVGRPD